MSQCIRVDRDQDARARCLLLAGALLLGGPAGAATAQAKGGGEGKDRMAAIVAAVREQEAKYRDFEYRVKMTARRADTAQNGGTPDLALLVHQHVVRQGDRVYLRLDRYDQVLATRLHRLTLSAYDGERTRSVNEQNCVNIHLGRFVHPENYPAHCLPLAHNWVDVPLSDYLGRRDTIRPHPIRLRALGPNGWISDFARVASEYVGEEQIDGLECVKIRVRRWAERGPELPSDYLWLAKERNYHCAREQLVWTAGPFGDQAINEMHADAWREIAPGRWLPIKLTVVTYDPQELRRGKRVVESRSEIVIELAELSPRHDEAFFRDIPVPPQLPLFTIKNGLLVGAASLAGKEGDGDPAKLAQLAAQVADQEKRYANIEVTARFTGQSFIIANRAPKLTMGRSSTEHSILCGARAYLTRHTVTTTLDGTRTAGHAIEACDGEWTRTLSQYRRGDADLPVAATLRRGANQGAGRNDAVAAIRPHTMVLFDQRVHRTLADFLLSPPAGAPVGPSWEFRLCGEQELNGLRSIKIRADAVSGSGRARRPGGTMFLWLALDRNLIPIKLEQFSANPAYRSMPAEISTCDDIREIAPGTWFPFHISQCIIDGDVAMAQGQIVLSGRHDQQVESVQLAPRVDDRLFREVIVPEGAMVVVTNGSGQRVSQHRQEKTGMAAAPAGQ